MRLSSRRITRHVDTLTRWHVGLEPHDLFISPHPAVTTYSISFLPFHDISDLPTLLQQTQQVHRYHFFLPTLNNPLLSAPKPSQ